MLSTLPIILAHILVTLCGSFSISQLWQKIIRAPSWIVKICACLLLTMQILPILGIWSFIFFHATHHDLSGGEMLLSFMLNCIAIFILMLTFCTIMAFYFYNRTTQHAYRFLRACGFFILCIMLSTTILYSLYFALPHYLVQFE